MQIRCSCGKKLNVSEDLVGKRVRCPACREMLLVGADEDESDDDILAVSARKSREPVKKKGRGKKKSHGLPIVWIAGGSIGAMVLVAIGVGAAMALKSKPSGDPAPAPAGLAAAPAIPAISPAAASPVATQPSSGTPPATTPTSLVLSQYHNVRALALSPDGTRLATCVDDRYQNMPAQQVKLWDVASGSEVSTVGWSGQHSALRFSPNGRLLVSTGIALAKAGDTASPKNGTWIWNLAAGGEPEGFPISGHQLDFVEDEKFLCVIVINRGISIIDLEQRSTVAQLAQDEKFPTANTIRGSQGLAAVEIASAGGPPPQIKLYDLVRREERATYITPDNESVSDPDLSFDGRMLAVATSGKSNKLAVLEIDGSKGWITLDLPSKTAFQHSVKFSFDGKYIVALLENRKVIVWDWEANTLREVVSSDAQCLTFAANSPDLYVGREKAGVIVINVATGESRPAGKVP